MALGLQGIFVRSISQGNSPNREMGGSLLLEVEVALLLL